MRKKLEEKDFEVMPHTADIQVRVYGATLQDLFRHALIAMFQVAHPIISENPRDNSGMSSAQSSPNCSIVADRITCKQLPVSHEISVTSVDLEALLVDFLSEALCLSDIYNEAYLDATIHEVTHTPGHHASIRATIHGIGVLGFEVVEIKAVTYHDLEVVRTESGWQADIVFDI
jgi:SHS2 domain-containing protein